MKVLSVIVTILVASVAFTQPYVYWERTYGGSLHDYGSDILETHDGNYVIVGQTGYYYTDDFDFLLMKVDQAGDTLWTRTYGDSGNDFGNSIVETIGWGYAIAGGLNNSICLIRTFSDGTPVWTRTYRSGTANDVKETSDAGYVMTGHCSDGVFLIKTDPVGNQEWIRIYGGYEGYSVHEIVDEGYIIVGQCYSGYLSNLYIIRTNMSGDSLWARRYEMGEEYSQFDLKPTADGGYIVGGTITVFSPPEYYFPKLLLMKMDANCDTVWTRTYGESGFDYYIYGDRVIQTSDRGFLLIGNVMEMPPLTCGLALKVDSLGNQEWLRSLGNGPMSGLGNVIEADTGKYMMIGSCNQTTGMGDYDVWLIAMGEVSGIDIDPVVIPGCYNLSAPYPNPFNSVVTVGFDFPATGMVEIQVYDVLGRIVGTLVDEVMPQGSHSARWDAGDLPSGIYFVQMDAGDYQAVKKVVLLK